MSFSSFPAEHRRPESLSECLPESFPECTHESATAPRITWTTFSSANEGLARKFQMESRALGVFIGQQRHDYCYGGDLCGLMGEVYRGVVQARDGQPDLPAEQKSRIIAVPYIQYYKQELDPYFCEVHVKHSLKEQQHSLHQPARHLVALPGGVGTRGEIWNTIEELRCNPDYAAKNLWLINIGESYRFFLDDIRQMLRQGLVREKDFSRLHVVGSVDELKERLDEPPKLAL